MKCLRALGVGAESARRGTEAAWEEIREEGRGEREDPGVVDNRELVGELAARGLRILRRPGARE